MTSRPRPRRLRLASALAVTLALAALPPVAAAGERLGTDVVPTFESVHLRLDADRPDYSGSVRVELDVRRATRVFDFHADGQTLTSVRVVQGGHDMTPRITPAGPRGHVTATLPRALARGPARLEIAFTRRFGTHAVGLYRVEAGGRHYSFTQFEANDARRAFPCWDEPMFKIPWQLTLEVPAGQQAVTNTPVEHDETRGGWRTLTFRRTHPSPSYLIAIATGPLEFTDIPGLGVPGRVVTVAGQGARARLAAETAPALLHALERWFGMPYPFAKLDLIAVPEFWPGAMENSGAITFADRLLLADPGSTSDAQRSAMARVMTHEMSHMWFGDLVTMKWWDDLWLNESFADWMGDRISNQVHPEFDIARNELMGIDRIEQQDAVPSTAPVRRHVETAENVLQNVGLAYDKGKSVLTMFEEWLGPETFRAGVNAYLREHEWGNATAGDLWHALDRVSGRDVSGVLAGWIEQPGLPLVRVTPAGGAAVRLEQSRYHDHGVEVPPVRWQIPVGLRYSDGDSVRTATVLLSGADTTVTLPGVSRLEWVMPNRGGHGYYRWTVPAPMLLALTRNPAAVMTPAERIATLGDLAALLEAGEIHGDTYVEALAGFAGDPDPTVTAALFPELRRIDDTFAGDDPDGAFAAFSRRLLAPAARRFSLEPRAGEPAAVALLRSGLLDALVRYGNDPAADAVARGYARRALAGDRTLDPSLAGVGLDLAARKGDHALFEELRERFERASGPDRQRYLEALGSFERPEMVDTVLAYALRPQVRPNEVGRLTRTMTQAPDAVRARLFEWMVRDYDAIRDRIPPINVPFLPMLAGGCDRGRLARARDFFAEPAHRVPGTPMTLARVSDQVGDCAALGEREGARVREAMARIGGVGSAPRP